MATWTASSKRTGGVLSDAPNYIGIQSYGFWSWESSAGTGDGWEDETLYTDNEFLIYVGLSGHLMPYISGVDSIWDASSKASTTWQGVPKPGEMGAFAMGSYIMGLEYQNVAEFGDSTFGGDERWGINLDNWIPVAKDGDG